MRSRAYRRLVAVAGSGKPGLLLTKRRRWRMTGCAGKRRVVGLSSADHEDHEEGHAEHDVEVTARENAGEHEEAELSCSRTQLFVPSTPDVDGDTDARPEQPECDPECGSAVARHVSPDPMSAGHHVQPIER